MTEWIEWTGGECPIPDAKAGEYEAKTRGGKIFLANAASFWEWRHMSTAIGSGSTADIIAYRLIEKEQSDLDWLEGEVTKLQIDCIRCMGTDPVLAYDHVLNLIEERKEAKS